VALRLKLKRYGYLERKEWRVCRGNLAQSRLEGTGHQGPVMNPRGEAGEEGGKIHEHEEEKMILKLQRTTS